MKIVDRYLQSVKSCLPAAQADDIIRELSENISAQMEDKESALGRSLTDAEVEAILKQHGHPLLVASRYRLEQRSVSFGGQIIGPMLFPFYIRVLKFNLGLTAVILLVIFGALFAAGQPIGGFPHVFLYQILIQFAAVTLIFWLMDRHFTRHPQAWDPRKPYGVRHPALNAAETENGPRIPRVRSISELIALVISLFWLRAVQHSQFLIFGPAAAFLSLSPAWRQLYIPIAVLLLLGMIHAGVNILRPDWVRFHLLMNIIVRLGGAVLCYILLRAGNLVVATSGTTSVDTQRVAQILNQTIYYGLFFSAALALILLANDIRKLIAAPSNRLQTTAPGSTKL